MGKVLKRYIDNSSFCIFCYIYSFFEIIPNAYTLLYCATATFIRNTDNVRCKVRKNYWRKLRCLSGCIAWCNNFSFIWAGGLYWPGQTQTADWKMAKPSVAIKYYSLLRYRSSQIPLNQNIPSANFHTCHWYFLFKIIFYLWWTCNYLKKMFLILALWAPGE